MEAQHLGIALADFQTAATALACGLNLGPARMATSAVFQTHSRRLARCLVRGPANVHPVHLGEVTWAGEVLGAPQPLAALQA